ncbi:unnamed protein product [Owenia fusiformis]|uniref:Uncharacterized protein n=1 Tax=Owenia fusiformis TaxID=6347 RepID=A0A8J1XGS6_OWEFU|nr:unnamed protein product [Owenia fusiformis]
MASTHKEEKEDTLNVSDSWVQLTLQDNPDDTSTIPPLSIHNGEMERLLGEAQREWSRSSSRVTSCNPSNTPSNAPSNAPSNTSSHRSSPRASPKSPHSPVNELSSSDFSTIQENQELQNTVKDWIWDWSSRPEAHPPSDMSAMFKHPVKKHKLSIRNTRVMRSGPFCLENLPTLLMSHACTFFLGAAAMFIYLRRYCNLAVTAPVISD